MAFPVFFRGKLLGGSIWRELAVFNMTKLQEKLGYCLAECGIDGDILNSVFESTNVLEGSSLVVVAREITKQAVSLHLDWVFTFAQQNSGTSDSFEEPAYRMHSKWMPSEATINLLLEELEYDRVEIGLYRESWKGINKGKDKPCWNSFFIKDAIDYFDNILVSDVESVDQYTDKTNLSELSHEQKLYNRYRIRLVVNEILANAHISSSYNKVVDKTWQPSKWVVNKLRKKGISKRFVFNERVLPPFINRQMSRAKFFVNYDMEYYQWVVRRFPIYVSILRQEKEELERLKLQLSELSDGD